MATNTLTPGIRIALVKQSVACLGWGLLLGIGLMIASGSVAALTIGELVVHSRPGKVFRASVPLTLQGEEQLAELQIDLATAEIYAEQQLERPAFLDGMHIGLLATGENSARIQLFGKHPWQGEEALLVLDAVWPQGQISRRFRLAEVDLDKDKAEQKPQFVEVAGNETLDAIAMRLSVGSNRSYLHMMYALFLANPEAFYRGNMNNLKRGASLRVPTGAELYAMKDAEVFRAIRRQFEDWRQQQEVPVVAPTQAGAMLSQISDTQSAALDLESDPHALQQQLQQLGKDNESIERRNAELKERLARLEQQIDQVSEQVLDYPSPPQAGPVEDGSIADAAPEKKAASKDEEPVRLKGRPLASESLPGYIIFIVLLLALGSGVLVWRNSAVQQSSRD